MHAWSRMNIICCIRSCMACIGMRTCHVCHSRSATMPSGFGPCPHCHCPCTSWTHSSHLVTTESSHWDTEIAALRVSNRARGPSITPSRAHRTATKAAAASVGYTSSVTCSLNVRCKLAASCQFVSVARYQTAPSPGCKVLSLLVNLRSAAKQQLGSGATTITLHRTASLKQFNHFCARSCSVKTKQFS